jgi:tetratricopeptide (TPR) repeat protein
MRKIALLLALAMSVSLAFAQKSNVSKAKNKALAVEKPDFAGARELIKPALEDPSTKDLPSTWHVAGLIGYKENDQEYQKQLLSQKFSEDTKGKAVMESYRYFLTADSLGELPDAKGKVKNKLRKDIKSKVKEYYTLPANLISYGAYLYDKKDYPAAYEVFTAFIQIPGLPMMENEIPLDSTYYMIKYYAALSASNSKMHDKAIALYEDLKTKDYEALTVYQLLYEEYLNQKDTAKFVQTLKDGFSAYPREAWFLQNLINYYIYSKQTKEALVYLNNAIENEPNIAQYHYVKGVIDEQLGYIDDAHASFDRAIELDSAMADAYAGKGRLIFNSAVKILDEANNIKDNKRYNAEVDRGEAVFKESLPYFIKATELDPKEIEHKRTLRTLYYRLKMDAEYEAINEEINEM